MNVIEVGIDTGEPLGTYQFLFVKAAVFLAKLGVSFGRNLPDSEVVGHVDGFIIDC